VGRPDSSPGTAGAAERYRILLEINNALISNLSREGLFRAIAQTLRKAVPFDRAAMFLFDAARNAAWLSAMESWGPPSENFAVGQPLDPKDSHVGWVVAHKRPLVRTNLEQEREFPVEDKILAEGFRSFVVAPLMARGEVIGTLNIGSKTPAQYSQADADFLQEVANQIALAVENLKAYEEVAAINRDLKQEMAHRKQAEETLQAVVQGTAAATGKDFFMSLVRHVAAALHVRVAFVTECVAESKSTVRTLAFWNGGDFGENIEYDLKPTPCLAVVAAGEVGFHPRNLQGLFPGDTYLPGLRAESFLGVPVHDPRGEVVGHLAVMDDKPMEEPRGVSILQTFAARAGAELARMRAEDKLRAALAEVESLRKRLEAENVYLQEEIRREHNFVEMVGNSPALLGVFRQVESVAPTDATVLIYGETGTGKELIARAIHNRSARRERPLVKVNCSAISAGLVESELFGHVKGAFTGAVERRVGRFELADGGTIFLDEVGELPLETQVKLLRVLQEQEFEPVGSSKTQTVDVRILAATNRDLEAAVAQGRFRSDLYYRLNVVALHIPPLRERQGDVPLLATYFIERYGKRFGKRIERVSRETMDLLLRYAWPGNVRELQNVIERAVVLARGNELELGPDLLPADASRVAADARAPAAGVATGAAAAGNPTSLEEVERNHILAVLKQTSGVVEGPSGAARILNLHPNTLRSRMKKLGIKKPAHGIS